MTAIEEFPRDLIVDPSLILTPDYGDTARRLEENHREMHFHVPKSLYIALDRHESVSDEDKIPPEIRFFNAYVDLPSISEVLERFQQLDVGRFSADRYFENYELIYEALNDSLPYTAERKDRESRYSADGDPLTDIIFEEYVFSQEHSGLVSRLKRTINNLIEAGISIIETSEKTFDAFCDNYLKDSDQRRKAVAKSLGKWVAISAVGLTGGAIGGLTHGVVGAGGTQLAIDLAFLLVFDP